MLDVTNQLEILHTVTTPASNILSCVNHQQHCCCHLITGFWYPSYWSWSYSFPPFRRPSIPTKTFTMICSWLSRATERERSQLIVSFNTAAPSLVAAAMSTTDWYTKKYLPNRYGQQYLKYGVNKILANTSSHLLRVITKWNIYPVSTKGFNSRSHDITSTYCHRRFSIKVPSKLCISL